MRHLKSIIYICLLPLVVACTPSVPKHAQRVGRNASTTPCYDSATLPPNIAPLNFMVDEEGTDFVTRLYVNGNGGELVLRGQTVSIPARGWKRLMEEAKGDTLRTDIYVRQKGGEWKLFRTRLNPVATEEVDPYIAYRLIEPSYVSYEHIQICLRDVTSFKEKVLVDNMMLTEGENGACVNCHSFQDYNRTGRFQAHIRQNYGGTMLGEGGMLRKVNLKTDQTLSAGVYPAWHPKLNLIAYSVNETGQVFHTRDTQKIEVLDFASDLILFDVERGDVYDIDKRKNELETFPAWSPDGQWLYFASAHYEPTTSNIDAELDENYKQLKYNIFRRPFDEQTMKFGAKDTVFLASALGKSAVLPRVSPDGQWLLFSMGDYGNFHIWHKSADLWVMDLRSGEARPLTEVNSPETDSYHSWSSNGRWILFSSRRNDGNYTRLYMAYFDANGQAHKAFELPQKDPLSGLRLLKSYNVPEWLVEPPAFSRNDFTSSARHEALQANYKGSALLSPDEEETGDEGNATNLMDKLPTSQSSRIDY